MAGDFNVNALRDVTLNATDMLEQLGNPQNMLQLLYPSQYPFVTFDSNPQCESCKNHFLVIFVFSYLFFFSKKVSTQTGNCSSRPESLDYVFSFNNINGKRFYNLNVNSITVNRMNATTAPSEFLG
jgi:hypothetical protein